jgi:hypothetical protein
VDVSKCSSQSVTQTGLHEIFHWIDHNSGGKLNAGMMDFVGAQNVYPLVGKYKVGNGTPPTYGSKYPYYPPNSLEDFAESAEEYFFPEAPGEGIHPEHLRWQFIHHLLTTGEILQP